MVGRSRLAIELEKNAKRDRDAWRDLARRMSYKLGRTPGEFDALEKEREEGVPGTIGDKTEGGQNARP